MPSGAVMMGPPHVLFCDAPLSKSDLPEAGVRAKASDSQSGPYQGFWQLHSLATQKPLRLQSLSVVHDAAPQHAAQADASEEATVVAHIVTWRLHLRRSARVVQRDHLHIYRHRYICCQKGVRSHEQHRALQRTMGDCSTAQDKTTKREERKHKQQGARLPSQGSRGHTFSSPRRDQSPKPGEQDTP